MTIVAQKKDKSDYARARSNVYKLLSIAFIKELSPESIEMFRGNSIKETLKDLGTAFGEVFYNREPTQLCEELAEEYAALFILPGGVNPTESVTRAGLYMQIYADQAVKFYKQCGFILPDDFRGFPDHIGIELEFISHLSQKEASAYQNSGDDEAKRWIEFQKRFLENHLSKWAQEFAKKVATYSDKPFYQEMAKLLHEFISLETNELVEGINT
ncbi:MAG: hypothetical protein A2X87_05095 [Deltaproteobacteria bacterium GWC2_42_51]|nr:MAG: hypothetical protein A2056_01220 [Deltaproteobacteria bacterium GWA2_42_85]OGP28946.1 MAG: hypothetical protein A2067_09545 [Deltaproteobacteria bacterium GWB2_42_7]OGP31829.1 MAG: hypothetical protein A2X87_05095 [Deltaproteobacteria bacterium GWC2_42_51]OGP38047.1 MAG: hypothetical protein A2090_11655 [Deltaproteobacteria bacterium GWD2_42_10]OGP47617.1 MAG: hypothetical protein A2022_00780 [Deltaproteobacteria bacterium GWF2_42_12]OGQ30323.1 MAG: hypothetical protein A3D29_07290 [De